MKRKILNRTASLIAVFAILIVQSVIMFSVQKAYAVTKVDLLTADNFVILAGAHVTDTNISSIVGDVGLRPADWGSSAALTCAEVTGTIYSINGTGPLPCRVTNDGLLNQAKIDLTTAFTDAGNRTPATVLSGSDNQLGGKTLTPGVYSFSHATTANIIGTLTLDTQGDPNAVFIFQAADDLITQSSSAVEFINGSTCNVFWHVPSSATLGTSSTFKGTIMADQSITDAGHSTVVGRFLARIVDVVTNFTTITKPTCTTPTSTPTPTPTPASTSSSTSSSGGASSTNYTKVCPNFTCVTPLISTYNRIKKS